MAKNLKLKIKNAQLAEALNLNKKVKPTSDSSKEKKASEKAKSKVAKSADTSQPTEKVKTVKKVKATDVPDHISAPKKKIKATNAPRSELPVEEEKKEPESPAVVEEKVVEKTEEAEKTSEIVAKEVKPVAEETKEAKKETKEVPSQSAKPKADKKPQETTKPQRDVKQQPSKKFKDTKAPKKVEQKSFDSRDRQGLKESDDGSWRRRRHRHKQRKQESNIPIVRPSTLSVKLPITVKDLASAMKRKSSELVAKLFMQGLTLTLNDFLDDEIIVQLIGAELNCEITIDTSEQERLQITDRTISEEISETEEKRLSPRAPVVAFMGHVDHGKTSLIDALRESNITAGEAGAITQHIGAFQCHTPNGDITILDTPGHEAFTEMRMRGATVTDVIILVIAGDEGMMPQTKEAIKHAKEAAVPIIVAINKCDKPAFNADDVYRQLADQELLPEKWGGQTITVNCSAVSKEGIPNLLEMILLQAEILELRADKSARARGTVIESQLHRGLGSVANVLVQNGTLQLGNALVFDDIYGRVKTMHNELGKNVKKAGPSSPVKITGLSGIPEAGCEFIVVENEKEAKKICDERSAGTKRASLRRRTQTELEGLLSRSQELSQKKVLNLILRADVQGSLEALKNSLLKIPSDKVELNIISEGVGQISESDVQLSAASSAAIIGFHTQVESHAEPEIAKEKITVKIHDIIYHLINDVRKLMAAKLDKLKQENQVGAAEVRTIFKSSHLGSIAGCQVIDGIIKRNHHVKVFRGEDIVFEGDISSLKRVKEDVKEVSKGLECGILLQNYSQFEEGDIIKSYEITYHDQEL